MADEKDLIKVKLDGGNWAKVYPELRHGTARRVEEANRKYLRFSTDTVKVAEGQPLSEAAKGVEVILDIAHADFTDANDIMILGQTHSWSYGAATEEEPNTVTQAVLDTIPEAARDVILQKIDELIKKRPLTGSGGKG